MKIILKEKCQQKLISFSRLISYFQQKQLSTTCFKLSSVSHGLTTSYMWRDRSARGENGKLKCKEVCGMCESSLWYVWGMKSLEPLNKRIQRIFIF